MIQAVYTNHHNTKALLLATITGALAAMVPVYAHVRNAKDPRGYSTEQVKAADLQLPGWDHQDDDTDIFVTFSVTNEHGTVDYTSLPMALFIGLHPSSLPIASYAQSQVPENLPYIGPVDPWTLEDKDPEQTP